MPHAYLFCGPLGVGKEQAALVLAQALECRLDGDDACGSCEQCRKVAAGRHPDVLFVRVPEGKSRVLIEQVRELQQSLAFRPFEGRNRVIVFPDAEVMTEEAANSLLKTLEEPPERTHFVLTSSQPKKLLDTIRSRCQHVRFAPLPRQVVAERLVAQEHVDARTASIAASLSEGSVGRAAELCSSGLLEERDDLLAAVDSLTTEQPAALLELAEAWAADKEHVAGRLDLLVSWYRDLLVLASGGHEDALIHRDLLQGSGGWRERRPGRGQARRCLDLLLAARQAVTEKNANTRLALECLFIGLATGGR